MSQFIDGPGAQSNGQSKLPLYKEYAWDFERDTFIYDEANQPRIVSENEALKVWVYKTLKTQRYRFLAYFDDYGITLEPYVGRTINDEVGSTALFFDVKEALLVNPYIKAVEQLKVENHGKVVVLTLRLRTVYGPSTFGIEV